MSRVYSDPTRASDAYSLPDVEIFYRTHKEAVECMSDDAYYEDDEGNLAGWYYWFCFPGCLPEGDAMGPYATEQAAIEAAQNQD